MVRFLVFALVGAAIAGLHWWLWRRLGRRAELPRGVATAVKLILTLGAAAFPLLLMASALLPRRSLGLGFYLPFFWIIPFSYLLILGLVLDALLRVRGRQTGAGGAADPERRRFLARVAGSTAALGTGAITATGVQNARYGLAVEEVQVRIRNWPAAFEGLRIAQLTDVHVSHILGREYVEAVVELTNGTSPDLIAITGDLIDARVDEIESEIAPLRGLRSRLGNFFVTGNHEYYSGEVEEWIDHLRSLGLRTLHNERVSFGDGAETFDLVGVPDWSRRNKEFAPSLARALEGRRPETPSILLAHQPKQIHEAAKLGIDLQISGHTHAGQIWPMGTLLAYLGNPYVQGLHWHQRTQIYVSRGTGYWGIPMRVGCPPEITLINIRRAD